MEVLFILIGFSLLAALVFLGSFVWAVKSGQYDDRYTPAVRVLFDDAPPKSAQMNLTGTRTEDWRSKHAE
jgi:cbb3-type cytochrome oxidase maturation protein